MKTDESEVLGKIDISDATRELVMQGMSEVTDEAVPQAAFSRTTPIKVGGKDRYGRDVRERRVVRQRSVHRVCTL
mgnify:CR=1 FL=1